MNPPSSTSPESHCLTRREAIRRILVATALAAHLVELDSFGQQDSAGIGWDPNLLKKEINWPRVLTDAEKRNVTLLADMIIPADEHGLAASVVGVPDFIDEWVSAPYDPQRADLKTIRAGLEWFESESKRRFSKSFSDASLNDRIALLDAVLIEGSVERKAAYNFFKLFRDRVAGGYYSTPEGWKALGYTGNTPLLAFAGPPDEALKHLGLA
ncbi:MAG TPA: gluconate 2-dehydrogenase subunit 3 family protein [Chthoniobacteraceae bacterium]|nr:gluconate 2-dehydrogenase subunit 3 family protein [Chthoniobacteraceae bacterium]